jgi:DNA-binding CsgD family transcriptional regulator
LTPPLDPIPVEPVMEQRNTPFGAFTLGTETPHSLTIPEAVRRCRWIAVDVSADEFGVYLLSPSLDLPRLTSLFDASYPAVSTATKYVTGSNGEDLVRHTRVSTLPCWWSDTECASQRAFVALEQAVRTTSAVPGSPGLAFPVYSERGQCGLVVFYGSAMAMTPEQMLEIHSRCFSLFDAVSMNRGGEAGTLPSISKRELECLKLSAKGLKAEEIAKTLRLSIHTTNQYLANTQSKLNAVNRMHTVAKALRMGLID